MEASEEAQVEKKGVQRVYEPLRGTEDSWTGQIDEPAGKAFEGFEALMRKRI